MNTQLDNKILTSIKERRLNPKPRWQFVLRNRLFWFIAGFTTLLGSFAVATGIFILTDHDWDVFAYLDTSLLVATLQSLPYLWLGILVLMLVITRYSVSHTRTGYRYRVRSIVLGSIIASIAIGTLLYKSGFGTYIHERLSDQMPWYEQLLYTKKDAWFAPEHGLLGGDITAVTPQSITVKAFDGSTWEVATIPEVRDENITVVGARVQIIGEETGARSFNAEDIEPWNTN